MEQCCIQLDIYSFIFHIDTIHAGTFWSSRDQVLDKKQLGEWFPTETLFDPQQGSV